MSGPRRKSGVNELPVFESRATLVIPRDADRSRDQDFVVLGRSRDGDRIIGVCGTTLLSVKPEAFAGNILVGNVYTLTARWGRDVAVPFDDARTADLVE